MENGEEENNGNKGPQIPGQIEAGGPVFYGTIYQPAKEVPDLEGWLADNCAEEWRVLSLSEKAGTSGGVKADALEVNLKVMFRSPADLDRFMKVYVSGRNCAPEGS
ncbi:MAG: hypothetical protein ISR51_04310 [Rhodospirillales bacterium]|nr:hypothetical protein [Alphaproteobacteria bacterium]MBL6947877.1 hypothetical protein [Rhodospirillales bacterium]